VRLAWRLPSSSSCERWSSRPVSGDAPLEAAVDDRYERAVRFRDPEDALARYLGVRDRLLSFDVYPRRWFRFVVCPSGPLEPGKTMVQRIGPRFLALEAGVRVTDVWDREGSERSAGFRYVTLHGHPERGVETFEVRMHGREVGVVLEARSTAGTWLTMAARPLARWIQRRLTEAAIGSLLEGP
jgi:uncharacterized protein (UPF0548 family)